MAAKTPENAVKAEIDKVLKPFEGMGILWSHRAVQMGMGFPTLDYTGCIQKLFFSIEAKAPGKKPTKRQRQTLDEHRAAGGKTFVISRVDDPELQVLREWLTEVSWWIPHDR